MRKIPAYLTILILAAALTGCEMERPTHINGLPLANYKFQLYSAETGIYPHEDVLDDPANMFVDDPIVRDLDEDPGLKWRIQIYANGHGVEDPGAYVLAFYCWSTLLIREPSGEHQFYSGSALKNIYHTAVAQKGDEVTPPVPIDQRILAISPSHRNRAAQMYPDADQNEASFDVAVEEVRLQAIKAFQKILDEFPDSVTYDESGQVQQALVKWAYLNIEQLGGQPEGWRRVGPYTNEWWYVTPVDED